jgi:hypothetical protein
LRQAKSRASREGLAGQLSRRAFADSLHGAEALARAAQG